MSRTAGSCEVSVLLSTQWCSSPPKMVRPRPAAAHARHTPLLARHFAPLRRALRAERRARATPPTARTLGTAVRGDDTGGRAHSCSPLLCSDAELTSDALAPLCHRNALRRSRRRLCRRVQHDRQDEPCRGACGHIRRSGLRRGVRMPHLDCESYRPSHILAHATPTPPTRRVSCACPT